MFNGYDMMAKLKVVRNKMLPGYESFATNNKCQTPCRSWNTISNCQLLSLLRVF